MKPSFRTLRLVAFCTGLGRWLGQISESLRDGYFRREALEEAADLAVYAVAGLLLEKRGKRGKAAYRTGNPSHAPSCLP